MSDFSDPAAAAAAQAYAQRLIRVTQVYYAAIYAVTVWDWIISIPAEYERMWKAPMSLIKILYYFNRYWTLAVLGLCLYSFNASWTHAACDKFDPWIPGLCMWTTVCAELILLIRTYAIWEKNRTILFFLSALLLGETVVLVVATTFFRPVPFADEGPCIATGGNPKGHDFTLAYWVTPIVFDTTVFVLTAVRCIRYLKRGTRTPLLKIFIRDGLLYFAIIFTVNLINTIFYLLPNTALQAVNSPMSLLMTSIMCSHIVLNLRGDEAKAIATVGVGMASTLFRRTPGMGLKSSHQQQSTSNNTNTTSGSSGDTSKKLPKECHELESGRHTTTIVPLDQVKPNSRDQGAASSGGGLNEKNGLVRTTADDNESMRMMGATPFHQISEEEETQNGKAWV